MRSIYSVFFLFSILWTSVLIAQPKRQTQTIKKKRLNSAIQKIVSTKSGVIGVSAIELETGLSYVYNADSNFAMQSVYKVPLALAVLSEVEKGNLSLKKQILIDREMWNAFSWSSLKRQNPNASSMSIDSLIMYMISYSDNLACDLLFREVGGPKVVDKFIHERGFNKIHILHTEREISQKISRMYENTTTPTAMSQLLKSFQQRKILKAPLTKHLLHYMTYDSTSHERIMGLLPPNTIVAHKTGTGYERDNYVNACNDVGIIHLPNGRHIALSIFVMNAEMNAEEAEKTISEIAKVIFDFYQ